GRAVVEDQRGHATQRIGRAHGIEVAEDRAHVVLEGETQQPQADGDAARVGRVVLSDENHVPIYADFAFRLHRWTCRQRPLRVDTIKTRWRDGWRCLRTSGR